MTGPGAAPSVYLYEDERARSFEPFALSRPVGTLMAGTTPIWARWESALGAHVAGFVAAEHLMDFVEEGSPPVHVGDIPAGALLVHARFAPRGGSGSAAPRGAFEAGSALTSDGRVAAVRLSRAVSGRDLAAGRASLEEIAGGDAGRSTEVEGWWMNEVWDFIGHLPEQLADDLVRLCARAPHGVPPGGAIVLGDHPVAVGDAAVMEPHVVCDATAGAIYVERGVHVHAFTKLIGPCYIGRDAVVLGGEVRGCAIGPSAKVRGEISSSVMLGFSNKAHDGFIGHSYLGRWVNLGAGTITSNLKNTYGTVALWTPAGVRDTGLQFLGTLFGDHVKTGIGLRLTTGCVIGLGANVYGSIPPKAVAPFAWGEAAPYGEYRLDKFLQTAERAMARRQMALTDRGRRQLTAAHTARWTATE